MSTTKGLKQVLRTPFARALFGEAGRGISNFPSARPPRAKNLGVIGDRQGRDVEAYLAKHQSTEGLRDRDLNAAHATDWSRSRQDQYQARYAKSADVGAHSHHIGDHDIWGKAMTRGDSDVIDNILVKNDVIKGNDAYNMVDAPGVSQNYKETNIIGKDHSLLHDVLYPELPTYKEISQYLETGAWNRLSPKQAASRLIALAREQDDIVVRWANWKLQEIYKKHPELKYLPPKKLREWAERNKQEFANIGNMAQMPSYKTLMKQPKSYNNEMLRVLFGLQKGNKPNPKGRNSPYRPKMTHSKRRKGASNPS
jgi:hypothetical protein